MLYLAIGLFLLALFFLWQSSRTRRAAGLPGGRIIYTDTRAWGKTDKALYVAGIGLTGKPDYLVEQKGKIIPVEVKTGKTPAQPYDSHIFQLASYCLLVEKTYGIRPPYGIIHYPERDFAIDYTSELENALLEILVEMRRDERRETVARSHENRTRCLKCGFQKDCKESLA
jgi:CRISPR-associated exonuclease Cas4